MLKDKKRRDQVKGRGRSHTAQQNCLLRQRKETLSTGLHLQRACQKERETVHRTQEEGVWETGKKLRSTIADCSGHGARDDSKLPIKQPLPPPEWKLRGRKQRNTTTTRETTSSLRTSKSTVRSEKGGERITTRTTAKKPSGSLGKREVQRIIAPEKTSRNGER